MNTDRKIIYNIKEKRGLPLKILEKNMKKWQKRLKLTNWKLSLKIVDFKRKNGYRQSGDFITNPKKKTATILMTWDPWRGDEEYTLLHEMLHVLVYDFDKYSENLILKHYIKFENEHGLYMDKLESLVDQLTRLFFRKMGSYR